MKCDFGLFKFVYIVSFFNFVIEDYFYFLIGKKIESVILIYNF